MRWDALLLAMCAYLVGYVTRDVYTLPAGPVGTLERLWLLLLGSLVFGGSSVFFYSLKGWVYRENQ